MTNGSVTTRRKFFWIEEDEETEGEAEGKEQEDEEGKNRGKGEKIMLAHRSTLLVYSLELPFASSIDFFSSRYENSFEWPRRNSRAS